MYYIHIYNVLYTHVYNVVAPRWLAWCESLPISIGACSITVTPTNSRKGQFSESSSGETRVFAGSPENDPQSRHTSHILSTKTELGTAKKMWVRDKRWILCGMQFVLVEISQTRLFYEKAQYVSAITSSNIIISRFSSDRL